MRLLLFDIDGTLLRGGGVGIRSSESAFSELFAAKDAWGDLVPDGKTDPLIFQEIAARVIGRELTSHELQNISDRYLHHLEREISDATNFRVLPGVADLLTALDRSGEFLIGLETGNLRRAAELKLRRAGLEHFFQTGGFACDSPQRSEIIRMAIERASKVADKCFDPAAVVVIGDAPQDVSAAKANGCRVVSVATGRHDATALRKLMPDAVLESLEGVHAVRALLDQLMS